MDLLIVVKTSSDETDHRLDASDASKALALLERLDGGDCSTLDAHYEEEELILSIAGGRDGKYIAELNMNFTEQVWTARGRLQRSPGEIQMTIFGRVEVLENQYLVEADEAKGVLRYYIETRGGRTPSVDWHRLV